MFCTYVGPDGKGYPAQGITYWLGFVNGGVNGEIIASIPMVGREGFPIWSEKYKDFESFQGEWEIA